MPMMQACTEVTRPHGVRTMVSLNTIMVDDRHVRLVSRHRRRRDQVRLRRRPDFDAHKIDFRNCSRARSASSSRGDAGQRRRRPSAAPSRSSSSRASARHKKYSALSNANSRSRCPERDAHERAAASAEVNLGYGYAAALQTRGRALHPVHQTDLHRRLPGRDRHPALHPPPRSCDLGRPSRRSTSRASFSVGLQPRLPAGEPVQARRVLIKAKMEPVAIGRLERFVGDNARPHPVAPPRFARSHGAGPGRDRRFGAGRVGRGGGPREIRQRSRSTRRCTSSAACCATGSPSFRLPRDIIDREVQRLQDCGVRFETNKVIGKTFGIAQLTGKMRLRCGVRRRRRRRAILPRHPGESAGQCCRPTSS